MSSQVTLRIKGWSCKMCKVLNIEPLLL